MIYVTRPVRSRGTARHRSHALALLSAGHLQDKEAAAAAPAEDKAAKDGKGKPKKVSAAVAAMQRNIEAQRAADEARAAAAETEKRAADEAKRAAEEEEKRKAEEKVARAEAKKAKREQLRKEGKLLTAKQKEEAARLERRRLELEAQAKVRTRTHFTGPPLRLRFGCVLDKPLAQQKLSQSV